MDKKLLKVETDMLVIGKMVKNKDKENIVMPMEKFMKVNIMIIKNMEWVS